MTDEGVARADELKPDAILLAWARHAAAVTAEPPVTTPRQLLRSPSLPYLLGASVDTPGENEEEVGESI
jgi:hypothetical protein